MATPETIVISASTVVPEVHRTIGEDAQPHVVPLPEAQPDPAETVTVEVQAGAADDDEHAAPPRAGAGSGRDAWYAYATEQWGLDVPSDATRDEIIALVDNA